MMLNWESVTLIQQVEIILLLIHLFMFRYEWGALRPVVTQRETLSLLSLLVFIAMMRISRIVGIHYDSIPIRTYLTALFGLIALLSYINWTASLIQLHLALRLSFLIGNLLGIIGFVYARSEEIETVENLALLFIIITVSIFMIATFVYVFRNSPYVRARQRLFILTFSYLIYSISEGYAVVYMGSESFLFASIFLLLTIPGRIGIMISILLPQELSRFLLKFIK